MADIQASSRDAIELLRCVCRPREFARSGRVVLVWPTGSRVIGWY